MKISRRGFFKGCAAAGTVSAFNIAPASVFGKNAPSNRITMALVGCGGQGNGDMGEFLNMDDVVVRAVCDVNQPRMESSKRRVDDRYKNNDCMMFKDFRDVCSRDDIDTVLIATPDHWHAFVGTFAASHGKDIYGEKPFTHDLLEGRALVNAVKRNGRIWQTGSWQRSSGEMRRAVELVRNGRIGKIVRVEVGLPSGRSIRNRYNPDAKVPEGLDWNFWLGPAPYRKYVGICDWDWRWVLEWGGGQLIDWIGHHADIAQWGLNRDTSGPVSFEGYGEIPIDGIYDSPTHYRCECKYADGIEIVVADSSRVRSGATWYGENGDWVWVDRGRFDASKPAIRDSKIEAGEIRMYSPGHFRNFIDCVKNRKTSITPAEVAHRSASVGHLCQIAILTGRKIKWNPDKEQIIDDSAAAALLGRTPRGPWSLT